MVAEVSDEVVDRGTEIEKCRPVQTNVQWPFPVDQRLNELLDQLASVGTGEVTRSRLLAALVARAPAQGDRLDELVRSYTKLTAGKVVLQRTGEITLRQRTPGRRAFRR